MKKLIFALTLLCVSATPLLATYPYDMPLTDSEDIITDTNYTMNLNSGRIIDYLSFQAVYSTEAYTSSVTFIDGVQSTGTISVLGYTSGSTITINSVMFVENRDFFVNDYTSMTALSLYNTLSSTPLMTNVALFSLANTESVIYATATVVGINYTLATSTPTAVSVAGMTGGVASDINYITDTITATNDFITGLAVLFSTSPGRGLTGLSDSNVYYAIPTPTTLQLATTKLNAIGGTAIDISSTTYPGWATYTLTTKYTGTGDTPFSFRWQASNDNENWYNLDVASITITGATAPTNYLWDLGFTTYKYIRCAVKAGMYGAIRLKLQGYGKRVAP